MNSNFDLNKIIAKSIESNKLNKFRILVGVSGGPDSVALLHSLNDMKDKYDLSIFGAHLNHGLRSTDSSNDQKFLPTRPKPVCTSSTIHNALFLLISENISFK